MPAAEVDHLDPVESFANRAGSGVEAIVAGHVVVVGRPALLAESGARPATGGLAARAEAAEVSGHTAVATVVDGAVAGLFVVTDCVKPSSAQAISDLRALGLTPVLLTGDNERTARAIADNSASIA